MDFNPFKLLGNTIGYVADTITDAPGQLWDGIEEQWDTKNKEKSPLATALDQVVESTPPTSEEIQAQIAKLQEQLAAQPE